MAFKIPEKWECLFADRIRERGLDYYLDGCVDEVSCTDDTVSATVHGTEDYEVNLVIENGIVLDMDCDCPYAEDGSHCKHEAALLYYIEDESATANDDTSEYMVDKTGVASPAVRSDELERVINSMSLEELKSYLYELCSESNGLRNRTITRFSPTISNSLLSQLISEIRRIAYRYRDNYGYLDWDNAENLSHELTDFVDEKISSLIDRGLLKEANTLTCEVFDAFSDMDVEDEYCMSAVVEEVKASWERIIAASSEEQQMEIFEWIQDAVESEEVQYYLKEEMDDFVLIVFVSPKIVLRNISVIDDRIEKLDNGTLKERNKMRYGQEMYDLLKKRVALMEHLNLSEKEIDNYLMEFSFLPMVLFMRAERSMLKSDNESAIDILKQARDADDSYDGGKECSDMLIKVYREKGDTEELKNEIAYNLRSFYQDSTANILELKTFLDKDDWEVLLAGALDMKTCVSIKYDLLQKEGRYGALLDCIEQEGSVWLLNKYVQYLAPDFGPECCEMYCRWAEKKAVKVGSRSHYKELVGYLHCIRNIGFEENAIALADKWKKQYSNRSAFLDELRKGGF